MAVVVGTGSDPGDMASDLEETGLDLVETAANLAGRVADSVDTGAGTQ